jgi:hypothetical protein
MRRARGARPGLTLVELMIVLLVTAVLGTAIVRTMITSNAFISRIERGREARGTSRAAMNLLTTELRMVAAESGVEEAEDDHIVVRVPFRLGLACATTTGSPGAVTAAFFPSDTTISTLALGYVGFATRTSTGIYDFVDGSGTPAAGTVGNCTGTPANITIVPGMQVLRLAGVTVPAAIPPGTPVFMWRRVRYEFDDSDLVPGRRGLWRHVLDEDGDAVLSEELAAPFDATSRFRFFILNERASSDTVPTNLADLRGIEFRLVGQSTRTAQGRTTTERAPVTMSVFFLNRLD